MGPYDLVIQLGSQVMYHPLTLSSTQWENATHEGYTLAPHTRMRTEASAIVLRKGIAPRLMIAGGSNFGVRYDDQHIFGNDHPHGKKADFSFAAFANADRRQSEASVIKATLVEQYDVDPAKVYAETLSSTTKENAAFVAIMLQRRPMFTGNEKIGILTLLYHMGRAFADFKNAGLNVEPIFAENVLANNNPNQINEICEYYATPKGGKQYDVARIRQLLTEGKSLEELIFPWWKITVTDGFVCADGDPDDLVKTSNRYIQAYDQRQAAERLCATGTNNNKPENFESSFQGPFASLELAKKT